MTKKEYAIQATVNVGFEINFSHRYPSNLTLEEIAEQAQFSADGFIKWITDRVQRRIPKKDEIKVVGMPNIHSFSIKLANEDNGPGTKGAKISSHFDEDEDEDEDANNCCD